MVIGPRGVNTMKTGTKDSIKEATIQDSTVIKLAAQQHTGEMETEVELLWYRTFNFPPKQNILTKESSQVHHI